jgi:hypothetical protein
VIWNDPVKSPLALFVTEGGWGLLVEAEATEKAVFFDDESR